MMLLWMLLIFGSPIVFAKPQGFCLKGQFCTSSECKTCEVCPDGHFQDESIHSKTECKKCSKPNGFYWIETQKCTSTEDSIYDCDNTSRRASEVGIPYCEKIPKSSTTTTPIPRISSPSVNMSTASNGSLTTDSGLQKSSDDNNSSDKAIAIGVGLGVPVPLLLIIVGIVLCCIYYVKRKGPNDGRSRNENNIENGPSSSTRLIDQNDGRSQPTGDGEIELNHNGRSSIGRNESEHVEDSGGQNSTSKANVNAANGSFMDGANSLSVQIDAEHVDNGGQNSTSEANEVNAANGANLSRVQRDGVQTHQAHSAGQVESGLNVYNNTVSALFDDVLKSLGTSGMRSLLISVTIPNVRQLLLSIRIKDLKVLWTKFFTESSDPMKCVEAVNKHGQSYPKFPTEKYDELVNIFKEEVKSRREKRNYLDLVHFLYVDLGINYFRHLFRMIFEVKFDEIEEKDFIKQLEIWGHDKPDQDVLNELERIGNTTSEFVSCFRSKAYDAKARNLRGQPSKDYSLKPGEINGKASAYKIFAFIFNELGASENCVHFLRNLEMQESYKKVFDMGSEIMKDQDPRHERHLKCALMWFKGQPYWDHTSAINECLKYIGELRLCHNEKFIELCNQGTKQRSNTKERQSEETKCKDQLRSTVSTTGGNPT